MEQESISFDDNHSFNWKERNSIHSGRHNTQHNDTQHNDTHHNDIQLNDE
jgi:hypothetical protein